MSKEVIGEKCSPMLFVLGEKSRKEETPSPKEQSEIWGVPPKSASDKLCPSPSASLRETTYPKVL